MGKCSLQVLEMLNSNIGDDGITAIAGTLSNSQISELDVSNCGITLIGARSLAAGLLVNNSVRILDVSNNNIGDDGITAIAETLSNSQIENLFISWCGITFSGARSLAAGLLVNNSVKILNVSGNPITVEGAHLMLHSAVDNGVCQRVNINEDYEDDDEVKKMIILEQRQQVGGCVTCCNTDCCQ